MSLDFKATAHDAHSRWFFFSMDGVAWIGRAQPSRVHTSEVHTVAQVHY